MHFRRSLGEQVLGEALPREGGGPGRKRLFRRSSFAGHGAGRIGLGRERKQRLAGGAIEEVYKSLLGRFSDGIDGATFAFDGKQDGRRGEVAVPDVVMDALKMPQALA